MVTTDIHGWGGGGGCNSPSRLEKPPHVPDHSANHERAMINTNYYFQSSTIANVQKKHLGSVTQSVGPVGFSHRPDIIAGFLIFAGDALLNNNKYNKHIKSTSTVSHPHTELNATFWGQAT